MDQDRTIAEILDRVVRAFYSDECYVVMRAFLHRSISIKYF